MKWYFAINESGLSGYEYMIKAALASAKKNTDLEPHCIYSGEPNHFSEWLQNQGVKVIFWKSTFDEEIQNTENTKRWNRETATGAYLRLDIPLIERNDDFILYTDCDVLFTPNFKTPDIKPKYFAAAPENDLNDWSYANTGSMIINVKNLRNELQNINSTIKGKLNILVENNQGTYDQAVLNYIFKGRWERLPVEYNWKPYWGFNQASQIIHFHGPKPSFITEILTPKNATPVPAEYRRLFNLNPSSMAYYLGLFDSFGFRNDNITLGHVDIVKLNQNGILSIEGWFAENGQAAVNNLRFFINQTEVYPFTKLSTYRNDVAKFLGTNETNLGFLVEIDLHSTNNPDSLKVCDSSLKYELILPNGIKEIFKSISQPLS